MTLEDRTRSLGGVGLSESDRFLFAVFAEEKHYPAETALFREGDAGEALCVIARGRVRISRRISGGEEAFAILSPGEIFGEMALLDPGSGRSADAVAHEDAVVLELSRDRFEALETADPGGLRRPLAPPLPPRRPPFGRDRRAPRELEDSGGARLERNSGQSAFSVSLTTARSLPAFGATRMRTRRGR